MELTMLIKYINEMKEEATISLSNAESHYQYYYWFGRLCVLEEFDRIIKEILNSKCG